MNTNLRNRPKLLKFVTATSKDLEKFHEDAVRWFIDFEKELREDSFCLIERIALQRKEQFPHRLFTIDDIHSIWAQFLKEVLGE